jgi:plastocyanin
MTRRLVRLALAAWLALRLAACGGGDGADASQASPESVPDGDDVTVIAEDIRFAEHTYGATAGDVAISYRNDGSIAHTLVIEGVDGFRLQVAGHGVVDGGSVTLPAGEYTLYCDVPGHRQAGMEAVLEVA